MISLVNVNLGMIILAQRFYDLLFSLIIIHYSILLFFSVKKEVGDKEEE